ncbi:metal-dependent transcriptional regulator [Desulfobulbus alkaliphilus]|uniref:metal-dependent transcriptional regulator n=1 Tax=Desulfobulbus alkaliphilus TaxID=869814 RepID=UPI00196396F5|nr:metal-dependent transcriptional regulator [Desulfobulbus alkaliphilus]MBM9535805.1 metal-dependent transcriptional regulator [Desulfobulbus alkaliphilus]
MLKQPLTASQEDYLVAVYLICKEKQVARAKDIARRLGVRASSVTNALRVLSSLDLINYAPYDLVTMTDTGLKAAKEVVGRHEALNNFFVTVLGVDQAEAEQAACKMEHSIPKSIVDRLIQYAQYVQDCPRSDVTWKSGFGYYCTSNCGAKQCERPQSPKKKPGRKK